MSKINLTLATTVALTMAVFSHAALAWDPVGDLLNPHRILKNAEREFDKAGEVIKDGTVILTCIKAGGAAGPIGAVVGAGVCADAIKKAE